jgi:hypothetical protein
MALSQGRKAIHGMARIQTQLWFYPNPSSTVPCSPRIQLPNAIKCSGYWVALCQALGNPVMGEPHHILLVRISVSVAITQSRVKLKSNHKVL